MNLTMNHFKIWKFPNGEWGVTLDPSFHPDNHEPITLAFKWPEPLNPDLMLPVMMGAAIGQVYGRERILRMPYMPYLRQDRSFEHGSPIASVLAAKLLFSTFSVIETLDAHSVPFPKLLNFKFTPNFKALLKTNRYQIVYPDENSPYREEERFNFINFKKMREGNKIELVLNHGEKQQGIDSALIVDDLCDGGATFIACAEKLRELGFQKIILCVTHGIFSKGVDHLFDNGIDHIITTDSVCRLESNEKLTVLDAFKEMDNE